MKLMQSPTPVKLAVMVTMLSMGATGCTFSRKRAAAKMMLLLNWVEEILGGLTKPVLLFQQQGLATTRGTPFWLYTHPQAFTKIQGLNENIQCCIFVFILIFMFTFIFIFSFQLRKETTLILIKATRGNMLNTATVFICFIEYYQKIMTYCWRTFRPTVWIVLKKLHLFL